MFYRIVETKRLDSQLYARVQFWATQQDARDGKPPVYEDDFLNDCLRLYPSYQRPVRRLNVEKQTLELLVNVVQWKSVDDILFTDVKTMETVAVDPAVELREQIHRFMDKRLAGKRGNRTAPALKSRSATGATPAEVRDMTKEATR